MLDPLLSLRSGTTVASLNRPWRFAPKQTYDLQANPKGLISFGTAENHLATDELVEFAQKNVDSYFLYRGATAGGPDLPQALVAHLNEYLKPYKLIHVQDVQIANSASAMHDALAWALADKGDAFLTSRPVYGRFELDFFNKSGVQVEYADTTAQDCFDETVVEKFAKALQSCEARGVKVKTIFIVNPNNPLGKCYPRKTLVEIMKFCNQNRLHLFSDEIYACSVFDSGEPTAVPFTSVLSLDTDQYIDPCLLHVTWGLSKDFGAAGLRIGALISRSPSVIKAVESVARFHNAAAPSLSIGAAMLSDREWCRSFVDSSRHKLAAAYRHVTRGLDQMGIEYLRGTNAGFFVWINLSPYLSEKERFPEFALATQLQRCGVFLHPKEEHSLEAGWFRLVYVQDSETMTEGLKR
ncbi:1-aminocyclopropane-1-carboxylate synthase-like protein-like protein [Emericellopsis cladophorae]|uniref:1-aminocyclopropane-1-carboxylate synthase-like protein-like protein n=1 Tax=Emericellopsis cladophorae TaxID=2686198 RepID=A0A9Q0BFC9_9HYPO|nr:1-aminocyclopropane-1-carboxylate synthase-like protein-like protein [Emericellopsis cladophorae]KAI6782555.1 1-aminocyclopropane-1-carboxylate synthase-like protein-like protein [Emericellopsis cladophorae]